MYCKNAFCLGRFWTISACCNTSVWSLGVAVESFPHHGILCFIAELGPFSLALERQLP